MALKVHPGAIVSIRSVDASDVLGGEPGIEIELYSPNEFPLRDQFLWCC